MLQRLFKKNFNGDENEDKEDSLFARQGQAMLTKQQILQKRWRMP